MTLISVLTALLCTCPLLVAGASINWGSQVGKFFPGSKCIYLDQGTGFHPEIKFLLQCLVQAGPGDLPGWGSVRSPSNERGSVPYCDFHPFFPPFTQSDLHWACVQATPAISMAQSLPSSLLTLPWWSSVTESLDVCQGKAEAPKTSLGQNRSNHCDTFKQRVLKV